MSSRLRSKQVRARKQQARLLHLGHIHHALAALRDSCPQSLRRLLRHYHVLGPVDHRIHIRHHQPSHMRNRIQNELPIAAVNLVQLNMWIEDPHLPALPDQVFDQRHHRALAQIVRVLLERQPKHSQLYVPERQHLFDCPLQMRLVARHHMLQQWKIQIQPRSPVCQRAQILRQTRPSERKPRLQIGRRYVQTVIPAQRRHHLVRRDIQPRAQ
jgi:hypothetical protein